jgi:hypothetical protein
MHEPPDRTAPLADDRETLDRTRFLQRATFGCPCHGGQYDVEGRPTAGPPVTGIESILYPPAPQ